MSDILDWLLEEDQPAARYHALTDLLDRPHSDSEVRDARASMPLRGWVADMLRLQNPSGYWDSGEELYAPKYTATNWRWLILADQGLTAEDARMRKTCELILARYAKPDGGFGWKSGHFCFTGNSARALIHSGYGDDPRTVSAIEWVVKAQKEDGGWHCFTSESGTLDCWEGLSAFAALPRQKWSRSVKRSVERGTEFYLQRQLFREGDQRYEAWFRLHYPVHYYYDILVGLDLMTSLGYSDDSRLGPALDVLRQKRLRDGRWLLDAVHPDVPPGGYRPDAWPPGSKVVPFALEKAGEPSKWITLVALRVLKRVDGELPK